MTLADPKKLSLRVRGAVAFCRGAFYNDGAEGESVHLVCDTVESQAAEIATIRESFEECDRDLAHTVNERYAMKVQVEDQAAELAELRTHAKVAWDRLEALASILGIHHADLEDRLRQLAAADSLIESHAAEIVELRQRLAVLNAAENDPVKLFDAYNEMRLRTGEIMKQRDDARSHLAAAEAERDAALKELAQMKETS